VPLEPPFQPVAALPLVTMRLPLLAPPAPLKPAPAALPLALLVPLESPELGTTVIGGNPAPPSADDELQPTADRPATVQKTASILIESGA
jgi:hypothetical protein